MTSDNDISLLKQRIAVLNQEISELEKMIQEVSSYDSDDDVCGEESPWAEHLSSIFDRLNAFSADRSNCEKLLRKQGVSVPIRDDY